MTLPLLLSVPHAGLAIPEEVSENCRLTPEEILRDGDEGAAQIYDLEGAVAAYVTTRVARAVVDLNRAEDDLRLDGVVKTHTCWKVPIWRRPLSESTVEALLARHWRPYHARLAELAGPAVRLGVDCHTMAAQAPPIAPDAGNSRPMVCLGDGRGTCPPSWVEGLRICFARHFPGTVTVNEPFSGGYITRRHGRSMPWVQVELSRTAELSHEQKKQAVLDALTDWCSLRLG